MNELESSGRTGSLTGAVPSTRRTFTPARMVALVVIGVLVAGLAYLSFASGGGSVSVPAGAKAGDLILKPCSYPTGNGGYGADCGTLVVPENRADPGSRLIALPVTRIRARSDRPAEPIFRLEGGPGITNMTFPQASRFADHHDVVLVGYRGVDGSSVLDCPEVASALKRSTDLVGDASMRAYSEALTSCAQRLRSQGVDLAGYTVQQRIADFEAVRSALGYDRVDLLSESAGTRTAMIYGWQHPQRVHRSVMIGVNPPGHYMWDPKVTDEQIAHYADLCSRDDRCRNRTADLATSMRRTAAQIPDHWWFLPIKQGNVRLASFFGLMESTPAAAPLSAPMTLDSWLSAAHGDPSGFWFLSLLGDLAIPESRVWGDVAAIGSQDAKIVDAYYAAGGDPGSILGNPGTDFLWGGGGWVRAWPATPSRDEFTKVRQSPVETLLVGGTVDFATPPANATHELLPHLPNGHQVVLAELGHTTDFWSYQPEAGNRLINTFFDTGKVDDSGYTHRAMDFSIEVTQTALAKGFLGTMLGFAILAVLSLVWLPYRVRKRAQFGPKTSVWLRSVYPLVIGLGGWFLGALIALTTSPDVPLGAAALAVFPIGVPVGLGICWAWVHRDWSPRTSIAGLGAAVGGSLAGAWLGFNATAGLLALVTTIVGAAVGANLALITLDIAWDRSGRPRDTAGREQVPPPETVPEHART